jgi:hypothetical protein
MRAPVANDLVIHILKDYFDGTHHRSHFVGFSYVKQPASIVDTEPPSPGSWANRGTYYRIDLRDYSTLDTPVPIDGFLENFDRELRAEIEALRDGRPHYLPFTIYSNQLRLNQGMYITRCTPQLFTHLATALQLSTPAGPEDMPGNTSALQEFTEGRRMSAERTFFARNPKLVRAAKKYYGFSCQACGFTFSKHYGNLGDGYIEVHHLNPLSEHDEALWDEGIRTSLADVRVVCSNCHRMLHRVKPPLSVEKLGEMIRHVTPQIS